MKKAPIVLLVLVGLALVATPRAARAQEPLLAHVPFPFMVGNHVMAPGDYRVTRESDLGEHLLEIVSRDGRNAAFVVYDDTGIDSDKSPLGIQFKKVGDTYVLWRVAMPGESVYEVPAAGVGNAAKFAKAGNEKVHKGNEP